VSSLFDYDDDYQVVFQTKTAGKALIAAKYDTLQATGDFLFLAHSDGEFAQRCEMIDETLTDISYRKLASVSDSKMKLVKALHTEWSLRHAKCEDCNCGKNRKIAKSTCEMCADGELDSDSPLCKACRSKEASRTGGDYPKVHEAFGKEAVVEHLTGLGELVGAGAAGAAILVQKHLNKSKDKTPDEDSEDVEYPHPGIGNIVTDKEPKDWEKEKWASRTANKYIEKRGDSWVILQKGTGKVLSQHSSEEKAEASFRAMMQSKHEGSTKSSASLVCKARGCTTPITKVGYHYKNVDGSSGLFCSTACAGKDMNKNATKTTQMFKRTYNFVEPTKTANLNPTVEDLL